MMKTNKFKAKNLLKLARQVGTVYLTNSFVGETNKFIANRSGANIEYFS